MDATQSVRAGAWFALAGVLLLVVMALVGLATGSTLGVLDQPIMPQPYGEAIRPAAVSLILVMALDYLFLIAYSGTFVGTAALVWRRAGLWAGLGLGFGLLTALVDISENAITVTIARQALAELAISAGSLQALGVLGQVKYACASLGLVFFAVALLIVRPARRPLVRGVAGILLTFPIVNSIVVLIPSMGVLLIFWMLLSLVGAALLLWDASRAGSSPGPEPGEG